MGLNYQFRGTRPAEIREELGQNSARIHGVRIGFRNRARRKSPGDPAVTDAAAARPLTSDFRCRRPISNAVSP